MESTSLTPAINMDNTGFNANTQLSPQEFQNTLYYWFNQKGLVSNMRSYLRMKMINALKHTTIGETANSTKKNVSMENQAINIIIADYLFHNQYDYSLSVFSTEIPIRTLVSEFCFFILNDKEKLINRRHKLDEENVICILESFGVAGNSDLARDIVVHYKMREDTTLLLSILKVIIGSGFTDECRSSDNAQIEDLGKFVNKILYRYEIPPTVISHIIEKVNHIIANQVNIAISKISKQYEEEINTLKNDFSSKEQDFKSKLTNVEKMLNEENKKIEKEHKKLITLTENMMFNEKKLAQKSVELDDKLKQMNELELKLSSELFSKESSKKMLVTPEPCNLKHCSRNCDDSGTILEELRQQKMGLEKVAENQNMLIENLSSKSNILYNELQKALNTIDELYFQLKKYKETDPEKTASSSTDLIVSVTGSEDEVTEEIIKESHLRLEQLEKESEEIDKRFKQFQKSYRNAS